MTQKDRAKGHVMGDKLEEAIHGLEELLVEAGRKRGEAERLEERKKQIFAVMFCHYRDDSLAIGECEQRARASKEYREASEAWAMANHEYREIDGRAAARRLRFEAWRTAESTERAKMNLR